MTCCGPIGRLEWWWLRYFWLRLYTNVGYLPDPRVADLWAVLEVPIRGRWAILPWQRRLGDWHGTEHAELGPLSGICGAQ